MSDRIRQLLYQSIAGAARVLLLVIITISPWIYAGANWRHQVSLVIAVWVLAGLTLVTVALSPGRSGRPGFLSSAILIFSVLAFLQCMPLPSGLIRMLAPGHRLVDSVALSNAAGIGEDVLSAHALSTAGTFSIDVHQTRASLTVFCSAAIVIWAAGVLFASKRWAIGLLAVLIAGGTLNAFVGLIQAVSWNGWTLLPMNGKLYFATFVSRNSAPQYYSTAIGAAFALVGYSYRKQRRRRRKEYRMTYPSASIVERVRNRLEEIFVDLDVVALASFAGAAFCLLAAVATLSRGGTLACIGASLVTVAVTLGMRGSVKNAGAAVVVLVIFVVGMMTALELDKRLLSRMDQLNQIAHEGQDGRSIVWRYSMESVPWNSLTGMGLGNFHFGLLPFHRGLPNVWFYHAESIPIEVLCEFGLPGLAVLLWVIYRMVMMIRRQILDDEDRLLLGAATFAFTAVALHSLVDFSLILPGIFLPLGSLLSAFVVRTQRFEQGKLRTEAEVDDEESETNAAISERTSSARSAKPVNTLDVSRWKTRRFALHAALCAAYIVMGAIGFGSLQGYADAELLEAEITRLSELAASGDYDSLQHESITARCNELLTRYEDHPEVLVVVGRALQIAARIRAFQHWDWPYAIRSEQRWAWADPLLAAAGARGSAASDHQIVYKAASEDRDWVALERMSHQCFARARLASAFEWRAYWGMLLSDFDSLRQAEREQGRGVLKTLCGNNSQVLADAAVMAFQDGDIEDAIPLMKQAYASNPRHLAVSLGVIADLLNAEELERLLPEDPVALASFARQLSHSRKWEEHRDRLLSKISGRFDAITDAGSEGWEDLAWVAEQVGNRDNQMLFLQRSIAMAPQRHQVRYRLACILAEAGKTAEAIEELKRCERAVPSQQEYRDKRKELEGPGP